MPKTKKTGYNQFDFIGTFHMIAGDDQGYREVSNDQGYEGHTIKFGVEDDNGNRVFPELHGGRYSSMTEIHTFEDNPFSDSKAAKITVPWDKRMDTDITALVADFVKTTIDLTDSIEDKKAIGELNGKVYNLSRKLDPSDEDREKYNSYREQLNDPNALRRQFIHNYDAVSFLRDNLAVFDGRKVRVRGEISLNEYKGNIQTSYNVKSLEFELREDVTPKLEVTLNPIFDENSIDQSQLKENGRVYVHGFLESWYRNIKGHGFYPMSFAIDTSSFDMSSEEDVAALTLALSLFKLSDEELGQKYTLEWTGEVLSKPTIHDEEEDAGLDLTDVQKSLLAAGIIKEEDIKPQSFGFAEKEFVLTKPNVFGKFSHGKLAVALNEKEFADRIVTSSEDVSLDEVIDSPKKDPDFKPTTTPEDLMADLFG